jgi:hypothetical protein
MRFPSFERGSLSLVILGATATLVVAASVLTDVSGPRGMAFPLVFFGLWGTHRQYRIWHERRTARLAAMR